MNVYNARVNVVNLTPVSHQNHSPQTSRAMRIALGMIINIRLDLVYSHTQRTKCVEQMSLHITKAVLTSAQQRKKNVPAPNVKSQTTLISTGQTGERSRSVKDRKRNHRLNGADIRRSTFSKMQDSVITRRAYLPPSAAKDTRRSSDAAGGKAGHCSRIKTLL
jgi:hypothetical protein